MWIRMISTAAGPRLPHALLSEKDYQVEDELGRELIDARAAQEIPNPNAKPAEPAQPATETAALEEGETAEQPGAEKKAETTFDKLKPRQKADSAKK